MCVICAAAKKRQMKRAEVLEAIRHNSAGFFGFTVHDGVRRTIRTLDDKQFVKFFDEVVEDEDPWVMHARIPSRGETSLDNVHGWEADGIIFCHNMTISSIDGMMKDAKWENTDSEFFFRHIFMPFYRGCGEKAYEDGRFCQDLDNIVRYFCGTQNKFLFIMPDNRLVTYGNWVTEKDRVDEEGKPAFIASNYTYKVYERPWAATPSEGCTYPRSWCYGWDDNDDDDADIGGPPAAKCEPAAAKSDRQRLDKLTELVVKTLGLGQLCRIALCDIAAHGAIQYRALADEDGFDTDDSDSLEILMKDALPVMFTDDTYGVAIEGLEDLAIASDPKCGVDGVPGTPAEFAERYAREIAEPLVKAGNAAVNGTRTLPYFPDEDHVEAGFGRLLHEWRVFKRIAGLETDFDAKNPGAFVCMTDSPVKEGGRWKVRRVGAEDVIVDENLSTASAFLATGRLLEYIRKEQADGEKGDAA